MTGDRQHAQNPESDRNREQKLSAVRMLTRMIDEAISDSRWWGKLYLAISVENGEIKTIDEGSNRTHKMRR